MDKFTFFDTLSSLCRQHLPVKSYHPLFIKIFLETANRYCCKSFTRDERINTAKFFYLSLYHGKHTGIRPLMIEINSHLKPDVTLEHFLSNLFFVVLGDFSKAIYGQNHTWRKITQMSEAVEQLIGWCSHIDMEGKYSSDHLSDEDLAITHLEQLRQKSKKVEVLNTYFGVPVQSEAVVVHTSAHSVLLKAKAIQELAAKLQGGIYLLENKRFGFDLYANVKIREIEGKTLLELSRFDQLSSSLHQRQTVRVQALDNVEVTMDNGGHKLHSQLFDLSLGGIATVTRTRYSLKIGTILQLSIDEEILGSNLPFDAELVYVSEFENGFKYHFKIMLTSKQELEIGRFITKRQHQIIQRLKSGL